MSFHTTIARLREASFAAPVAGENPNTCRVGRQDLRTALHVIDRLDADLRQAGTLAHGAVDAAPRPVNVPVAKPLAVREDFAHEVWAAAQSPHGEPMEKSVARVASLLAEASAAVAGQALSEQDSKQVEAFIDCDGLGAMIVEADRYSAVVRALQSGFTAPQASTTSGEAVAWEIPNPHLGSELTSHKARADEARRLGLTVHELFRHAAPQASEAVRSEQDATGRTPTDYALEFAEYLARDAEYAMACLNASQRANESLLDLTEKVASSEAYQAAEEAAADADEAFTGAITGLQFAVFEFRKRRDRAALSAQPAAEPLSNPKQFAQTGADERTAFEATYQADYDDPGAACEREHFGKGYRAGLAAQSTKEQGERDA